MGHYPDIRLFLPHETRSLPLEIATMPRSDKEERQRIQQKQGGHHMPPKPDDGPPLDDTDRNSDKVIKPSQRKP
jgi:hypothetical protein